MNWRMDEWMEGWKEVKKQGTRSTFKCNKCFSNRKIMMDSCWLVYEWNIKLNDGLIDGLIDGSMGQWVNGSMDQWINGSMDQWINGSMGQWVNGSMY